MRRREFILGIGLTGAGLAGSLGARAQQADRIRRIGVLSNKSSDDSRGREEAAAFVEALKVHGWISGGNLQIDYRWGAGDSGTSLNCPPSIAPAVALNAQNMSAATPFFRNDTVEIVVPNSKYRQCVA